MNFWTLALLARFSDVMIGHRRGGARGNEGSYAQAPDACHAPDVCRQPLIASPVVLA